MDDGIAFKVTPLKTAGMLLLLALIPLVAGYVRGHQVRADAVAFAADGVATTGKVLNKTSEFVRNSMRYTVYFEYKDPNGVTYQESEILGSSSYDGYRVGGPIKLTYLRSRPDHFYLPDYTPGEQYAHIFDVFFYIGLVGTLVSLGWMALLLRGSSGGGIPLARLQPDAPSAPRSQPARSRAAPGAQGFGRR
jgi:hypothetical protein